MLGGSLGGVYGDVQMTCDLRLVSDVDLGVFD